MYKVELLPTALEDIQEIMDYISTYNPNTAKNTFKKIIDSLRRLEQFPNSGAFVPDHELKKYGFRMVIATPYISFYKLVNETVYICHIVHGAKEYHKLLDQIDD